MNKFTFSQSALLPENKDKFCVYWTTYLGSYMPRNYIGYTSVQKIIEGYHGSVSSKKYKNIWLYELNIHPELFFTRILFFFDTDKEAIEAEEYWHRIYDVANNPDFINMSIGYTFGGSGENHPCYGITPSEETKEKLRQAHLGKILTEEHKHKLAIAHTGLKQSEEHIKKRTEYVIGNQWNVGKKDSEETKLRKSEAQQGKLFSDEHKINISKAKLGHKVSEETRKKISQSRHGKKWWNNGTEQMTSFECPGTGWFQGRLKFSEEHKQKLATAKLGNNNRIKNL